MLLLAGKDPALPPIEHVSVPVPVGVADAEAEASDTETPIPVPDRTNATTRTTLPKLIVPPPCAPTAYLHDRSQTWFTSPAVAKTADVLVLSGLAMAEAGTPGWEHTFLPRADLGKVQTRSPS